jgi:putative sigma-54 modulation protein
MRYSGMSFTDAMKDYAEDKIKRLDKFIDTSNATITAVVLGDNKIKVEISLGSEIRASKVGEDFYALVIDVVEQLDGQIRRYRTSNIFKKRRSGIKEFELDPLNNIEVPTYTASKEKFIEAQGMSFDDAVEEMELLGHTFFIYRDIDRLYQVCVVYKRTDGNYGLLRVEDDLK